MGNADWGMFYNNKEKRRVFDITINNGAACFGGCGQQHKEGIAVGMESLPGREI